MGIFSFNQGSYSKAGKGVEKDAKTLVRPLLFFTEYFGKYGKILLANVLYLVLCIPVITIGPATAGYTYVLKKAENIPLWPPTFLSISERICCRGF